MMSHFQLMTSLLHLTFLMYLLKVSVTASSTVTVVNIFAIFWFLLSNFPHFHWIWSVIVQVLTKVGYVSDFYVVTFYSLSSFSYLYIFLCCLVILVKMYHWSSCHLIIFYATQSVYISRFEMFAQTLLLSMIFLVYSDDIAINYFSFMFFCLLLFHPIRCFRNSLVSMCWLITFVYNLSIIFSPNVTLCTKNFYSHFCVCFLLLMLKYTLSDITDIYIVTNYVVVFLPCSLFSVHRCCQS